MSVLCDIKEKINSSKIARKEIKLYFCIVVRSLITGGRIMNTMELDAHRGILAREILNTDSEELLMELENAYRIIKDRLAKMVFTKAKAEPIPDSKEYILNSIKEGYQEMQEIKAGKRKGKSLDALIEELELEEA